MIPDDSIAFAGMLPHLRPPKRAGLEEYIVHRSWSESVMRWSRRSHT